MERILDLPAHPLMIHFPAVAIPLLGLIALGLVGVPRLRSQWRLVIILLSIAVVVTTFLAAGSGQALADAISSGPAYDERIDTHKTLGETLRFFVLGMGITTILLTTVGSPDKDSPLAGPPAMVLNVLAVAFAVLSVVWAFRTGHEGAKIHWEGILPEGTTAQANESVETAAEVTTTTAPATTAAADTTAAPETTVADAAPVDGMAIFEANCARCHGSDGAGGRGPSLQGIADEQPDPADAIAQTTNGGRGMPSFGDKLTEEEIVATVDYLREAFPAAAS